MTPLSGSGADCEAITLYRNGRIYTQHAGCPWAEAMLVVGGRIQWVGQDRDAGTGAAERTVDLGGRRVLPGLMDAHAHFLSYALLLPTAQGLNLRDIPTLAGTVTRVAEYAAERPEQAWIEGHGWNENSWVERRLPSRHDLDSVLPGRPVVLRRADGHLIWVNTCALEMAGISDDMPDPAGGKIDRDEHGRLTGILRERAISLVTSKMPAPTLLERAEALRAAQREALSYGLVGVHTMEGSESLEALQLLRSRGELVLRVLVLLPVEALDQLKLLGLRPGFGDDRLRLGQLKLFADGSLGSHTAWMLAPYEGEAHYAGIPVQPAEELARLIGEAHAAGWPCAVHAIGDAANRAVLDAFERAPAVDGTLPDRIEHVQILHPDDLPRLGRLGVIASMQPAHVATDWALADRLWGERCRWGYAWRSLLASRAVLAFGSDAPVESINPWPGIQVAVTRRDLNGQPAPGWYPEESLTLAEAIAAFTRGVAAAGGQPDEGRLAPGCRADFIVLEEDPFAASPEGLKRLRPVATVIGGKLVSGEFA